MEELRPFLDAVNESYLLFESNRELVERVMRLSSDELADKNAKLEEESERQKLLIDGLRDAIKELNPQAMAQEEVDQQRLVEILREAVEHRKKLEVELIHAREDAESALEARKIFLANMSHEIRTPINAIIGMSSVLSESGLTENQMDYLNAIQASSEGLMVIVNDILDISKLESGKFRLEELTFDLDDIVTPLMRSMSLKAHEKGIALTLEKDMRISRHLLGDPTRITQVLTNLISNAIKFTNKGHVKLEIQVVEENSQGQTLRFNVIDTGIGIDQEQIDKIFEQFTQADTSITRKYGGTGLGLSISRNLVEMMGGALEVSSKKGEGSVFGFTISFKRSSKKSKQVLDSHIVKDLRGLRVLVVEDNDLNRFLAITLLQKWNAVVDTAVNGLEALERLQKGAYDIVLMDLQMPEMDGFQAVEAIRNKMNLSTPVVALTANALFSEKERCLSSGMNDYMSKPYKPEQLYEIILLHAAQKVGTKPSNAEGEGLFALHRLEELCGGNRMDILRTAEIFVNQLQKDLEGLRLKIQERDYASVKSIVHRVRPNLEIFEVNSLVSEMPLMELYAETRNQAGLERKLALIETVSAKVIDSIQSELSSQS